MGDELRRYKLSPRAKRDLLEIWLYTRDTWSIVQADSYYQELINSVEALATGVKRGKPIDDIHYGYLSFASGSHRIIYRHANRQVLVIRILHQRMNVRQHL
ncbi:type II toxin-antitoxin system RelE/ParE family toxin [Neorhizobium sp. JUb45]|uniref:type II toxin-antitoxin system RelE/ParE family toxin n=1 Tax=unclassified Neorhizobium TaxID=2629175 RepID=UPI0010E4790B|nr:type II toxin-antitoxin system RelE/ParE family toxin [Neorhizobium sp. JUb45]TCR01227.1 toxin ParE1/3/4 [Neorhizobium sp. JUb45]